MRQLNQQLVLQHFWRLENRTGLTKGNFGEVWICHGRVEHVRVQASSFLCFLVKGTCPKLQARRVEAIAMVGRRPVQFMQGKPSLILCHALRQQCWKAW